MKVQEMGEESYLETRLIRGYWKNAEFVLLTERSSKITEYYQLPTKKAFVFSKPTFRQKGKLSSDRSIVLFPMVDRSRSGNSPITRSIQERLSSSITIGSSKGLE